MRPLAFKRRSGQRWDAERAVLNSRVSELEARLDHERLFPGEWANRRVRDHFGNAVQAGPFQGMTYPEWGLTSVDLFAAKVIGSFECELHDAIETLIAGRPDVVINIGSAEGYYAVGMALRLPDAKVIAYDTNAERTAQLQAIAQHNGVGDRIEALGRACEHSDLTRGAGPGTTILCDCDGAELELLDPAVVPALCQATILVEAHDLLRPGIADALASRHESSHVIERIPTQRFVDDYRQLDFMPLVTRQLAISEFRGAPMEWLVLWPRDERS
jgi:predicted O-methyltransferase YrrM